uniref:Uncharacterized protein n=1 Tax=Solanum tuberosum TaxID=4113 RepID=M1BZI8_SOLTU
MGAISVAMQGLQLKHLSTLHLGGLDPTFTPPHVPFSQFSTSTLPVPQYISFINSPFKRTN